MIRIITNSKYEEMSETIREYSSQISNLKQELEYLKFDYEVVKGKTELLKANNTALNNEIKSLKGAKGGYTKQINKLKAALEETQKKLEESMTDKYLVKKIPMGKLPKGQVMQMKSHAKQDKIIKKVYEKMEKDEI